MTNKLAAIILSGGKGSRFNNHYYECKVICNIIDKPLILYTINALMTNNILLFILFVTLIITRLLKKKLA